MYNQWITKGEHSFEVIKVPNGTLERKYLITPYGLLFISELWFKSYKGR